MLPAVLAVFSLLVATGPVLADSPRHTNVWGFALDVTPSSAGALLGRHYPQCALVRSLYHPSSSHPGEVTAALEINGGLIQHDPALSDACAGSPAGSDVTDAIELRFMHPGLDAAQRLYRLDVKRVFSDPVYATDKHVGEPFEALREQLFRKYGKPTDTRRDKVVSTSENRARSLGVRAGVQREDYLVRYLWSREGRLPAEEREDWTCQCGGPYVKAEIEISRSPLTIPKNRYYVLSVRLLLEDPGRRARQDVWSAQWQTGAPPQSR